MEVRETSEVVEQCWARPLVFSHGILNIRSKLTKNDAAKQQPHSESGELLKQWNAAIAKLSVRLADIASGHNPGKLAFKILGHEKWKELAKEYLGWDSCGAGAVLALFNSVYSTLRPENCSTNNVYQVECSQLREFVLFVWIQFYPTFALSMKKHNEYTDHWPDAERDPKHGDDGSADSCLPDSSASKHTAGVDQVLKDGPGLQMQLIRSNLATILQTMFVLAKETQNSDEIPRDFLRSLSLLIECPGNKSLHELSFGDIRSSSNKDRVPFQQFHRWVTSHIKVSPPHGGSLSSNPSSVPRKDIGLNYVRISNLEKETVVVESDDEGATYDIPTELVISGCNKCYIYVLRPFKFVHIIGCSDCTIVTGPVAGVATLELSNNLYVVSPIHQLVLKNSLDSTLMIFAKLQPVIVGDCRGVVLGPYNTFYPALLQQLRAVNMVSNNEVVVESTNSWNRPYSVLNDSEAITQVRLITPAEFLPFTVPVDDHDVGAPSLDDTNLAICYSNPFRVPTEFVDAMQKMLGEVDGLIELMRVDPSDENAPRQINTMSPVQQTPEAKANGFFKERKDKVVNQVAKQPSDKELLQSMVKGAFHDWLISSGKINELEGLAKIATTGPAKLVKK